MDSKVQDRIEQAEAELTLHRGGVNSSAIADSLWAGLTTLRKLFLTRLHPDSEPFPEDNRGFRRAAEEIEIYSMMVVVAEAEHSGYINGDLAWFRDWLLRLRWGDEIDSATLEHIQSYENHSDGERRRMFASSLEQSLPEATAAPLIIYRLYPRAVRIAAGCSVRRYLAGERGS